MAKDAPPIRQATARGRVREDLRRLILSGELPPGSRLTQQQLASRFGVAQSVIRESLLELQFSGLVQSVENLGAFVCDFNGELLLQAYQVREVLEGLAARSACQRAGPGDLRELQACADRIAQRAQDGPSAEREGLDREFHRQLVAMAKNPVLSRLPQAYHVLLVIVRADRHFEDVCREHADIIAAIERNDPPQAERCARLHVANSRAAIQKQIVAGRFIPRWVVE